MKFHQKEESKPQQSNENDQLLQIANIMAKANTSSSNNMNMIQALMSAGSGAPEKDPNPVDSTANDLPEILYTASHDKTIQVWNTKVSALMCESNIPDWIMIWI